MSFPDIVPDLKARMPELRGRLLANQSLAELTLVSRRRPGAGVVHAGGRGRSRAISSKHLPADIPVTVIGAGSNLIVRDGGVPGVVVRLGRGFNEIAVEEGHRVRAGTAVLDVHGRARGAGRRHRGSGVSSAAFPARSAARCA